MTMTTMTILEQVGAFGPGLFALKSVLWLSAVAGVALLLKRAPAAARGWVWTLGLFGLLALPALEATVPSWDVLPTVATATEAPTPASRPALRDRSARPTPEAAPQAREWVAPLPEVEQRGPATAGRTSDRSRVQATVAQASGSTATSQAPARVAAEPTGPARTLPWTTWALIVWALGAVGLLLPLLRAHRGVARIWRASRPVDDERTLALFRQTVDTLQIRRAVELRYCDGLRVPVTAGEQSPRVLLPSEAANWPESRVRNVLLHELAHVRRHDWATQWFGAVVRSVYWFNPLAWLAHARQKSEAELACDDLVLARGSRPSEYAGDLVAVARAVRSSGRPALGLVAMARSTDLEDRVEAILDERRARGWQAVRWVGWGSLVALLVAAPIASLTPAEPEPTDEMEITAPSPVRTVSLADLEPSAAHVATGVPATVIGPIEARPSPGLRLRSAPPVTRCRYDSSDDNKHRMSLVDDDEYRVSWSTSRCSVFVDWSGDVRFRADDSGIERMADRARFSLEEDYDGVVRRVEARSRGGSIEYRFWVDGDEADWDSEAQAWFSEILVEFFRHTTFNAEARVDRILGEGGPDALFAEVQQIASGHVAAMYLRLLMEKEDLSERELGTVLDVAGERIDSDHALGELLMTFAGEYGLPDGLRRRFLNAATTLESDHQMGQVLGRLLQEESLPNDVVTEVLWQVENLESDHQASQVLMGVLGVRRLDPEQRQVLLDVSSTIDSDHAQGQVLHAFLDQGELSSAELADVLDASLTLESDHQRSELLKRVMQTQPLEGAALDSFLRSARAIDSDHALTTTALIALERAELSAAQIDLVLDMTSTIDSDHNTTQLALALLARDSDLPNREWDAIMELTGRVASDHNRGQIANTLLDTGRLDEARLLDILDVIDRTDSEHQVSEALRHMASTQTLTPRVRDRYIDIAEGLSSEHQRDRALAALARSR